MSVKSPQRFQEEGSSAKVCVGAGKRAANPPLLMALSPCGRKVCEVAARIPTQVKLLFATLAPASAAEPTQAMSMDERLSQARHSKGAPSLTSLTSPRGFGREDI